MSLESPWRWVLWPAAVTLAVTVVRLTGELLNWNPVLFNRSVGGGAAPIGIIWLVPVFGAYYGYRLRSIGQGPQSFARALAWHLAALAAMASFLALGFSRPTASASQFLAIGAGSWLAIAVAWRGWPPLVSLLVRYGFLSRVPVALVVLLAILCDWRTHYDTPPPGLPAMGTFAQVALHRRGSPAHALDGGHDRAGNAGRRSGGGPRRRLVQYVEPPDARPRH
jgi:hypothetical protein